MGVAPRLASHPEKVLARRHLDREQVLVHSDTAPHAINRNRLETFTLILQHQIG